LYSYQVKKKFERKKYEYKFKLYSYQVKKKFERKKYEYKFKLYSYQIKKKFERKKYEYKFKLYSYQINRPDFNLREYSWLTVVTKISEISVITENFIINCRKINTPLH
jgi:hypothetical protein